MALPKPTAVLLVVVMIVASFQLQSTMGATTHIVGDNLGWTIPLTNGADTYTTWASQRTFSIGDTLVFNFTTGFHTVAEVSQAATSDPCTATSTLSVNPVSPVTITLTSLGPHQYICTIIGHCQLGQKLTIYVSPAVGTPESAPILSPPSSIVTPPFPFGLSPAGSPFPLPWNASPAFDAGFRSKGGDLRFDTTMALPKPTAVLLAVFMIVASSQLQSTMGATTHIVGDDLGWTIPLTNGAATYTTWASQRTFSIGDTLVFNFTTGFHTVAEVSQAATSDPCTATSTMSVNPVSPVSITLTSPGTHQYICTIIGHCQLGQKLTIYVSPAAGTPESAPILSPPSSLVTPPFNFGLSPVGSPIPLPWSASPAFAAVVPYTFLALALAFFY